MSPSETRRILWLIGLAVLVLIVSGVLIDLQAAPTTTGFFEVIDQHLAFDPPVILRTAAIRGLECTGPAPSVCYGYAFSVHRANAGLLWSEVGVLVQLPSEERVPVGSPTRVGIVAIAVCSSLGPQSSLSANTAYSLGNSANLNETQRWAGQAGSTVMAGQILILYVAGSGQDPDPLAQDDLIAFGQSSFSGIEVTPIV